MLPCLQLWLVVVHEVNQSLHVQNIFPIMHLPNTILDFLHCCFHPLSEFWNVLAEKGDVHLQLLLHLHGHTVHRGLPCFDISHQIHTAQRDVWHRAAINCILQGMQVRHGTTCHRMRIATRGLRTQRISLYNMLEAQRGYRNPRYRIIVIGKANSTMVQSQFLIQGFESSLTNSGTPKGHNTLNLPSALLDVDSKQCRQSSTKGMTSDAKQGLLLSSVLEPWDHCQVDRKVGILEAFHQGPNRFTQNRNYILSLSDPHQVAFFDIFSDILSGILSAISSKILCGRGLAGTLRSSACSWGPAEEKQKDKEREEAGQLT